MFNACSIALIGDESLSLYLRCLTSIELFKSSNYYASHPLIFGCSLDGKEMNENTIFSILISDVGYKAFQKDDRIPAVIAESINVCKNFTYSPFLSLLALCNAIGRPIESYFPIEGSKAASIYEKLFNCLVEPNPTELLGQINEQSVHIFWCASMPDNYISTITFPAKKDHFVALMLVSEEGAAFLLPPFLQKKYDLLVIKNPISSVPPVNMSLLRNKRKQLAVDDFVVKVAKSNTSSSLVTQLTKPSDDPCVPADDPDKSTKASHPSIGIKDDVAHLLPRIREMTMEEKNHWVTSPPRPSPDFCYPADSSNRKFLAKWFNEFPWLAYSKTLNGAYCVQCILFSHGKESTHNGSKLEQLYSLPFRIWSNGPRKFRDHWQKSPRHRTATAAIRCFRQEVANKSKAIDVQLNKIVDSQIKENREKLIPIIGAIILCGRQNIALRGHRDDAQRYNSDKHNPGNLQEILKFLELYGNNSVFEEHMANAPRSATYRSKTTQNEILAICGEIITSKLSLDIKESKYFSILADEAADVNNVEQMPLVVRYVNSKSEICEVFTGFIACDTGVSGEAISEKVLLGVQNLSLDMDLCRGQGYDGAGNMAGKCSGAAARITAKYPKVPYVHCGSHALNLSVASACNIQVVRNMMGHVRVVSYFFNASPKRFDLLGKQIKELERSARHTHLIDVCRTRWLAWIDGLDVFLEVFLAVVNSLMTIKDNVGGKWNHDSVRDASGLFHATVSFGFIVCIHVVSHCLEITRPLTKQLQSSTFDVVAANKEVSLLFVTLQRMRMEISQLHSEWYDEAEELASSVNVEPSQPRVAQRQVNRANTPSDTISQYYERSITLPFLDHLTSQLQTRFSERNLNYLNGFFVFPTKVVTISDWKEKFMIYANEHLDDLPEQRYLGTELRMWEDHCMTQVQGVPPSTLATLLPTIDRISFTNIYAAMQILATLPVTTCTCERSISTLRRLKTYLRNAMTENRLNNLALLHIHRDIHIDVQEVVDRFAIRHPHRMKLVDILNSGPS